MELEKIPNECAFDLKPGSTCMDESTAKKIKNFAVITKKISDVGEKEVIDKLKQIYECDSESCLLTQGEIRNVVGESVVQEQLKTRFKPSGPWDTFDWLSNFNIDEVLDQVSKKHADKNFLHIPYQMRDFEEANTELANIDFVKKYQSGIRCFGIVFNTDLSSGGGKHWFCIYGDMSKIPITIEYFNSSGESPLTEISTWMKKTKHSLEKGLKKPVNDIVVSKIQYQNDNHSCGTYSLYYILSRLSGSNVDDFKKNHINDKLMHEFRKHLFRKTK
jgi:hypothetical protein